MNNASVKKVIIMSGISDSGKSDYIKAHYPNACVFSASKIVKGQIGPFSSEVLSNAHARCFRDFIRAMAENVETVVIDNTNLSNDEISPYIVGAQAYGYDPEIITLIIHPDDIMRKDGVDFSAHKRNVRHIQYSRLLRRKLLPWWKNTTLEWNVAEQTWEKISLRKNHHTWKRAMENV